jgi:hypothetical protein
MTTAPIPARDGSHEATAQIFVTVELANGKVPDADAAMAAFQTLEGWSGAELVDAESGGWLVTVPAQTEASLRHEGWLETWAITPGHNRMMISAEWVDEPEISG